MTNLFKYLYLICGCIGLYGAWQYLFKSQGIAIVFIGFILCVIFRMLYIRGLVQDQEKAEKEKNK